MNSPRRLRSVTPTPTPTSLSFDCFKALFPCASVTGAPKVRTMEIISDLEKESRGVYTGAIGYFTPDGRTCLNVAIRTLVVDADNRAEMGIGSGVVYDSDPAAEYDECLLKARFLTEETPAFQLIETMLSERGRIELLDHHLDRLRESALYFAFDYPAERIRAELERLVLKLGGRRSKLRLLLSADGRSNIESTDLDDPPTSPVRIKISEVRANSQDRFLFHKTTHRPLYCEHGRAEGYHEVIFLNERREVTEGSISNVFVDIKSRRYTPPVSSGLLAGTLRRQLLESGECRERVLYVDDLLRADAIYIGNSVGGLRTAILEPRDCDREAEMFPPRETTASDD